MQRLRALLIIIFALPMFLVACGANSATGGTDKASEVTITVKDNYFEPKNINVAANQKVKVTFINKGVNVHIVEIKGLVAETTMQPGESKSFTITPQKRSYKLYDELYVGQGMEGTFVGGDGKAQTDTTAGSNADIKSAIAAYHTYVMKQADDFVQKTEAFTKAVDAGDITKAKSLYAVAREPWERIEPIASTVGDLDPKMDAREGDLPEDQWTGFHRIEKALWVENSTKGMEKYTKQLLADAKELRKQVETVKLTPTDIMDGSVALLGEAAKTKVTGEEERYSRTDLYDLDANVEGSKAAFEVFEGFVQQKNSALFNDIESKFAKVEDTIKPFRSGTGFVDYGTLKDSDKRNIAQALNALGDALAKVTPELPAA